MPEENIEVQDFTANESPQEESLLVRENPSDFPADIQRKYFWQSEDEYERVQDYEGDVWVFQKLETRQFYDPYAKEYYDVVCLVNIETNITVKIKIPMTLLWSLKSKIDEISFLFSALERYPEEEFLVLDNILLKYVPWFLSSQEYSQLKNIGVVFDENIVSLFE